MVDLAIGIDIGGTRTKIGLVAKPAQIVDLQTFSSNLQASDPTPFLETASSVVSRFRTDHPVKGIGIALCSLINDAHTGALLAVNAPALNSVNLQAEFEARFHLPVQVINDVNAYALAEYRFGAGQGVDRLLCLGLGTGLTIAVIIKGTIIENWGGIAGDVARIILDPDAEVMCKGKVRGSAEALCGTAHIERLALQRLGRHVPAQEIITACRQRNHAEAIAVMAEVGEHVGHLLAILCPIFYPYRIVITGGTAEAGEPFFQAIRERFSALIGEYMQNLASLERGEPHPVEIVKGALGPEAAVIGAVDGFF